MSDFPNSSDLLYFLALGRLARDVETGDFLNDQHELITYASSTNTSTNLINSFKSHCKAIMSKGSSKLQVGKRIRLTPDSAQYDLHVLTDGLDSDELKTVVFFAITHPKFDQHQSITQLFKDFKSVIYDSFTVFDIEIARELGKIHSQSQSSLSKLLTQYNSSKLMKVQSQVAEVKSLMSDNIAAVLSNVESLESIEMKSSEFESAARQFDKGSRQVSRRMKWKYYKWGIIIAITIATIIGLLIWWIRDKQTG